MSSNIIELSRKELVLNSFEARTLGTSTSISNQTWTKIAQVNIEPGIWLFNVNVCFAGGATGRRGVGLYVESGGVPGSSNTRPNPNFGIQVQTVPSNYRSFVEYDALFKVNQDDILDIFVYHNQGSALTCYGAYLSQVRLA